MDPKMYEKYWVLSNLKTATQVLVTLRGLVEGEAPCTDVDFCLKLLHDNPMLYLGMCTFSSYILPLLTDNPPQSHWTSRSLFSDAVQSLQQTRVLMEKALENAQYPPGPLWKPTMSLPPRTEAHIRSLLDHRPVVLLYDLGSFMSHPILCKRLDDIFHARQNTFLVNGSASGKTKLLYEGLCKHWGLFFTCALDGTNLGADDLVMLLKMFPAGLRDTANFEIISDARFPPPSKRIHVHAMAHMFTSVALLSRLLLFKAFLEASASSSRQTDDHKRLWLLFQLQPSLLHADLKDSLDTLKCLVREAEGENWFLDNAIRQTLQEIFLIWTPAPEESLFIVVDEANCCTDCLPVLQESDEDRNGIPFLKELLRVWHYHTKDFNVTFVVAGVRIVREYFSDAEWESYRWSSNTGSFAEDPKLQQEYLDKLLPSNFARSASGRALSKRMTRWLKGRHRLTASFATELLEQGFQTPHLYLNKYIRSFASCDPTDERRFYEPGKLVRTSNPYNTRVLSRDPDYVVLASVHDALVRCLVTGKTDITFGPERIDIVSQVIGRFKDADMQKITIDEPLILSAAGKWFSLDKEITITSLSYYRQREFRPFRTLTNATYFILLGVFHAFVRPCRLTDLLQFSDVPAWAHQEAQLIKLHKLSGKQMKWSYLSYLSGIFTQLAWASEGPDDTQAWFDAFEHGSAPPICVHDCSASPTIIFPLRLRDDTAVWIALKVLMDPNGDIAEILQQMHPDHIFASPSHRGSSSPRCSSVAERLQQLPCRRTDMGKFSLIRVLAPLYDEVRIGPLDASEEPPCAVLDMSRFDEITSHLSLEDIFRDVIANVCAASQPTIDFKRPGVVRIR
ncbi:hypothetical protein BDZ89DRAFT_1059798 [Hymenopellis radicata]|nr:hypothetical protein BDZ89DRAFT_1059798 [Hymenopellis radicata]